MGSDIEKAQDEALLRAVARLRAGVMAIVFGTTCGVGLWVATVWLVIRGGHNIGAHLGLLRFYFPGYSVTWPGAFIGLGYGILAGGLVGFALAWIYNRLAGRRAG
jgi:hypothetical protein